MNQQCNSKPLTYLSALLKGGIMTCACVKADFFALFVCVFVFSGLCAQNTSSVFMAISFCHFEGRTVSGLYTRNYSKHDFPHCLKAVMHHVRSV